MYHGDQCGGCAAFVASLVEDQVDEAVDHVVNAARFERKGLGLHGMSHVEFAVAVEGSQEANFVESTGLFGGAAFALVCGQGFFGVVKGSYVIAFCFGQAASQVVGITFVTVCGLANFKALF